MVHNNSVQRRAAIDSSTIHRKLSITETPIAELQLDPDNPRLHSPRQVQQIARSIEAFGFLVPALIDARGRVIAGEGRIRAAQVLGLNQVPTIRLDHLSEAQTRAFVIADNRLTENAAWNDRLLAEQLKELSELELDFSVEVTGFETSQIDLMVEGLSPAQAFQDDPADEIPPATAKPQVTRLGDLWILDRHRIYCGDARDDRSYAALMNGKRAAAVFTDPPYNDPIDRYVTNFGRIQHAEFAMASGEMSGAEFKRFLQDVLVLLARHSVNGALHFVCMDWRHTSELLEAANRAYTEFKNLCVWVKDVAGQGSLYRSQHELIFVFKSGTKPHRNNIQLGKFGRYRTNIWGYHRVNSAASGADESDLPELHPTIKPVELVADAILDCTARREIVLDAFLGSGTTVIAAERTGRSCYGLELDPRYVDTSIRRWEKYTGQKAIHADSSKAFDELEQEATNEHRQG